MDKLARFRRLPWSDQSLLCRAAFRLSLASLAVHLLPFSWWRSRLNSRPPSRSSGNGIDQVNRIVWAVEVAARHVPGATCLVQSIVGAEMLRHAGHQAEIHVGVSARPDQALRAHAWVESEGLILLGGEDSASQYTPLVAALRTSPMAKQR